jgi:hypothetical protein
MNLKVVAATCAALGALTLGALALLVAPADAAPKKKNTVIVYDARGRTVFTSRDEDGRARTRIIVQRRSYHDPGTEVFPGENSDHRYAFPPNYSATNVLDNTAFGGSQTALPNVWTLPGRNNPWIGY